MTLDTTMRPGALSVIPNRRTLFWLFVGGFLGLMAWEIWARLITSWILGGPLEPAELVISLVRTWTGYELARLPAEAAHYAIGIFGYPILYFIVSRSLRNWALALDIGVWSIFTVFLAALSLAGQLTGGIALFWAIVTGVTATRFLNPNSLVADCLSWGSFTWFNALGIMAPLAGLPFLLVAWGGGLSFMSYVGHVIFGFIAALVFELKAGQQR
ncbi:hypothetical protein SLNSH_04420 [Alsobacter soli]|uniref:Uncharacterized protein n=1 Tax=Alsobacter soli TaxID=2109933 RepID=A0A2T1HWT7_9HYPH|nr:hypothetical protein [Alsobacter soli]PSC06060.1 hypothetical protein SLNSH_04420 [Alsobacter soli]